MALKKETNPMKLADELETYVQASGVQVARGIAPDRLSLRVDYIHEVVSALRAKGLSPDVILPAWDDLHGAIQAMACAQPWQMTQAYEKVEEQRKAFNKMLQDGAMAVFKDEANIASAS